ncbi:MAG: potassium channel family protein, partial [Myxococcales bacterium]|nr:potassium channel family protein [Myxococcales bacterium]
MNRNRGRFSTLLGALVVTLFGVGFLPHRLVGLPSIQILFSGVFVAGVYAVSRNRRVLVGGSLIAAAALTATWWRTLAPGAPDLLAGVSYALDAIFFGYVAWVILDAVLEDLSVTADTIYGGVCVYLLIAMLWVVFYSAIEHFTPGAFQQQGVAVSALPSALRGAALFGDFIYFSFVTITTLGYGDITPMS